MEVFMRVCICMRRHLHGNELLFNYICGWNGLRSLEHSRRLSLLSVSIFNNRLLIYGNRRVEN